MNSSNSRLKIKVVPSDNVVTSNNSNIKSTYKISFDNKKDQIKVPIEKKINIDFKLGDSVRHIDEKIIGQVKFINDEKMAILWEDGSRERFAINDLDQLEHFIDLQEQKIDEIETINSDNEIKRDITKNVSINKQINKSSVDDLFDKALSDMDDQYDDIGDGRPQSVMSLEKKVNKLEKQIEDNKIKDIKEKAVDEIISLMKDKKMLLTDEAEKIQRETILRMDDECFESFRNSLLKQSPKKDQKVKLTDAEIMLQKIKAGGPIIGGPITGDFNDGDSGSRDLSSIASNKKMPVENNLNFEGFKDLKGLTKPLQVVNKQTSPRQGISEAISSIDWTTISKMF